jgi:hypothetical protein
LLSRLITLPSSPPEDEDEDDNEEDDDDEDDEEGDMTLNTYGTRTQSAW